MALISVVQDDITQCKVDAIVNAANNTLSDGVGVNGAIQRAAGPELLAYCKQLNGCATGQAVLTPGFKLAAKYIIHTVGPIWQGGMHNEAQLLASCYINCLKIAHEHTAIRSIAFPALSCGVFGYPLEQAAQIAVKTIIENMPRAPNLQKIVLVCFDNNAFKIYKKLTA